MTPPTDAAWKEGRFQALGAIILAVSTATVIFNSDWGNDEVGGRLAITGVVLFSIALAFGSARLVGIASMPVLGGALAAFATADEPAWLQSIVLGTLWYAAVELAWDSIERRNGVQRSSAVNFRRVHEISSIVVVSLAVSLSAYGASALSVPRTAAGQALMIAAVMAALGLTIRHVAATSAPTPEKHR